MTSRLMLLVEIIFVAKLWLSHPAKPRDADDQAAEVGQERHGPETLL